MKVKIKICGITNRDDALAAVDLDADALGFVFFKKSPRFISYKDAATVITNLPSFITTIGVFVDEKPDEIDRIKGTTGIDIIQLHGNEPPEMWMCG